MEQIILIMEKKKVQKYIVTGEKQYKFSTRDFSVRKSKKHRIEQVGTDTYKAVIDGVALEGNVSEKKQNKYKVNLNGNCYSFVIDTEQTHRRKVVLSQKEGQEQHIEIRSPMPGKICDVFINEGAKVQKGEALLVLEAMKMQNQILASSNAVVESVMVKPNETVLGDQLLIKLKPL